MSSHVHIETTGDAPVIYIESIGGNLRIKGRENAQIVLRSDYDGVPITTSDDGESTVRLSAFSGDCRLETPENASIKVGAIGGDADIKSLAGEITIERVGGNLRLRKVGSVHVKSVGGDLKAKKVDGDFFVEKTGGNAVALDVEGSLEIGKAGGDIVIAYAAGDVAATAGGNAKVRSAPAAGQVYRVDAGGDISCYLPANVSAAVKVSSRARTIKVRGWDIPHPNEDQDVHQFTLGAGEAELELNAGGNIALRAQSTAEETATPFEYEFDFDFGPDFQMGFDSDFGPFLSEWPQELSVRIQEKVQRAVRVAEEKVAEALRQAEERIARAEAHTERMDERRARHEQRRQHAGARAGAAPSAQYSWTVQAPPPPAPPKAAKAPQVSDEERMAVLRMVEEGKISVEQAEKLLQALSK
ncbi:MAG: hypothetical protein H6641_02145 [Caldilineaceae bacterium]|nr:hypothetical protein [Caldilineaceae bacterium]